MKSIRFSGGYALALLALVLNLGFVEKTYAQNDQDIYGTWIVEFENEVNEIIVAPPKKKKPIVTVNGEERFILKCQGNWCVGGSGLKGRPGNFRIGYVLSKNVLVIYNTNNGLVKVCTRASATMQAPAKPVVVHSGSRVSRTLNPGYAVNLLESNAPTLDFMITIYQDEEGQLWVVWGSMDRFETLKARITGNELYIYKGPNVFATISDGQGETFKLEGKGLNTYIEVSPGELADMYDVEEFVDKSLGKWTVPNGQDPDFLLTIEQEETGFVIGWNSDRGTKTLLGELNRNATSILGMDGETLRLIIKLNSTQERLVVQSGKQSVFELVKVGSEDPEENFFSNPVQGNTVPPVSGGSTSTNIPAPSSGTGVPNAMTDAMIGTWVTTRDPNGINSIMQITKTLTNNYVLQYREPNNIAQNFNLPMTIMGFSLAAPLDGQIIFTYNPTLDVIILSGKEVSDKSDRNHLIRKVN